MHLRFGLEYERDYAAAESLAVRLTSGLDLLTLFPSGFADAEAALVLLRHLLAPTGQPLRLVCRIRSYDIYLLDDIIEVRCNGALVSRAVVNGLARFATRAKELTFG
jgi:hypothetical protein